jgi:serine/threonine protein kinase
MPLVPSHWRILAGPPSLSSCTRDVYDPGLQLEPGSALNVARAAASAVAHLNSHGLLHGDVYAHNLLCCGTRANAVLTDFGAASVLPSGADSAGLQPIEVRALGLLFSELLSRTAMPPDNMGALRELATACMQPDLKHGHSRRRCSAPWSHQGLVDQLERANSPEQRGWNRRPGIRRPQ